MQNASTFPIQINKTTDITKISKLIFYVRYFSENDIDFLCYKKLEGKTTGEKILETI